MKLFEKVKNMFTEEIEDEKPIRKEVRQVEIPTPKREEEVKIKVEEPKKEEKLLFFDDKDFEDLEREEEKVFKPVPKKVEPLPYQGVKPTAIEEPKKVFKPSPIISPVYGVLDKNYKKEDIVTKSSKDSYRSDKVTVDDVRQRAFSTLEDDLKNEILEDDYITSKREVVEDDLDIFKDIEEDYEMPQSESIKEEKMDIIENDSLEDDFLDETEELAKKLEEQKRKLDEINDIINESKPSKKTRTVDEYLYREEEKEETLEEDEEVVSEVEEVEEIFEDDIEETIEESEEIEEVEEVEESLEEEKEDEPKSLDEVYKDTLDDIEEASVKSENKKGRKTKKQDMSDSELLNLIDSMYEKSEEDE